MLRTYVHGPVELLFVQVECKDAIIAAAGDEEFALVDTDALAVGKVRVLPGALGFELSVIGQQAVAGSDVKRVTVQCKPAKTTPPLFAKTLDVREIVLYGVEDGLVGEVDEVGATVGFTLGGAVNNRGRQ